MASITQTPGTAPHLLSPVGNQVAVSDPSLPTPQLNQPRDVTTTFNYYKENEDGSPPEPNYVNKPSTFERPSAVQQHVVHDVRGSEDKYTLDTTGFQFVKHESVEKDFVDEEQIKAQYYPEVEELLKKTTGASRVFIFDHTIRRNLTGQDTRAPAPTDDSNPTATPVSLRGPVQRVHIDQSYAAGPQRVEYHLPSEAPTLLKGRYQIINVWRPIKTIFKDPLGVASATSVQDEDLVPVKLIYPNRVGETCTVKPNEKHEWHYLHGQTPGEPLLIKCFDSKTDGRARRVPHSAFVDEEYKDTYSRESIEVRTLVFHEDDHE